MGTQDTCVSFGVRSMSLHRIKMRNMRNRLYRCISTRTDRFETDWRRCVPCRLLIERECAMETRCLLLWTKINFSEIYHSARSESEKYFINVGSLALTESTSLPSFMAWRGHNTTRNERTAEKKRNSSILNFSFRLSLRFHIEWHNCHSRYCECLEQL